MIKNVLFDLDGTIINSKEGIVNAFNHALKSMNIEYNGNMDNFIGPPLNDTFKNVFNLSEADTIYAMKKFREYYKEKGVGESELYKGIKDLIIELKNSNKKLILATSKAEVFAKQTLQIHEIKEYFDFISGATLDSSRVKKADVIKYAIDSNNLNIDECIMVGDRAEDIRGANQNNMKSIGVLYGFGSLNELQDAGANYIAKDINELKEILYKI